jgi:hypothetical protein
VSYIRVKSEIEEDNVAKSENADDGVEGKASHSAGEEEALSEVDARGGGDTIESDTAPLLSTVSVSLSAPPPPPISEAVAGPAGPAPEVAAVPKRVRPSRWDTVKASSVLDTTAAHVMVVPPIPPPPTFTYPPPPPPVQPLSIISAEAPAAASEQCVARPSDRGNSMLTLSATGLVEAATSDQPSAADDEDAEAEVEVIVLKGVRSEHLRLMCDVDGNVLGAQGEIVSTAASRGGEPPPVEVVASTGNPHPFLECPCLPFSRVLSMLSVLRIVQLSVPQGSRSDPRLSEIDCS